MHAPLLTHPLKTQPTPTPSPRPRSLITGTGLLTPLGLTPDETWTSLMAGGSIRAHAPIPLSTNNSLPRISHLAIQAAQQAIQSANWTQADLSSDSTALILATSKGPIESWTTPPPEAAGGSPLTFGLSQPTTHLAQYFHLGQGPRLTISAACATGLHALIHASLLLESHTASRVLIVAAESSLSPLFTGSFNRLGVLTHDKCRPFDQHRSGFLMSEGAAALCLEPPTDTALSQPATRNSEPGTSLAIESYALGADPTHLTATDPTAQTLRHLLITVLNNRPVDFIHTHGTATLLNDASELSALESTLTHPTPIYSHKAALGHSLGAAGLTSVVLSSLIHHHGLIPPNLHTTHPMPTRLAKAHNESHPHNVQRSLTLAAGFGGSCAAISLISQP